MPRWVPFAAVAFSITFGLHYYVWARLIRDPALPQPWRAVATVALVLLGASMPLAMAWGRAGAPKALTWTAYVWMGLLLLFFILLLMGDLARLLFAVVDGRVRDPERRVALARLLGSATAVLAAGLGAWSTRNGLRKPVLAEHEVTLDKLPRALDGLVVVQMTDVHVGPTIGREMIDDLVARTNALEPDIVAITGDLVDGSVRRLREQVAPLGQLKAKRGVFFVTGNHEYYSGAEDWIAELGRLGVRVLRNERVDAGGIDVAGVDDHSSTGMLPGHGPDLDGALDGRDPSREVILLAHQPRAIHEAAAHDVGLVLSGHTHGGQIWPWMYFVRLQQPYTVGFAKEGRTQLYVSPGTGYWGPPMRLGTRAELTKITLRAPA
jgi:uncharacterized protein